MVLGVCFGPHVHHSRVGRLIIAVRAQAPHAHYDCKPVRAGAAIVVPVKVPVCNASAKNTGTICSGNQPALITPHTATLVNPLCCAHAKGFHRHYGGEVAPLTRHYS